jgi:hypothetical protein
MDSKEILVKFTVEQMLAILPAEIIFQKKRWFLLDEVFELAIRKSKVFNTWTVEYYNERSFKYYYHVQNVSLPLALATILSELNEGKFIEIK